MKIESIPDAICIGFEFSKSISGKTPPIIPKKSNTNAWLRSINDAEYKGAIEIPETTTAVFICCAKDAIKD
ncbi:hypothetical protein ALC152_07300 [Arcobacter sp. 15-2]